MNNSIKQSFNKAAYLYNQHCDLQVMVGKKLVSLLDEIFFSHIIDLGCGTGLITELLAKKTNYTSFSAIDIADQLLLQAKQVLSPYRINVFEDDFDQLTLTESYFDLIFANMSLHWSHAFQNTLKHLANRLNHQGTLAFSIPLPGTFKELSGQYRINQFMEVEDIKKYITDSNLLLKNILTEEIIFSFDSLLDALKSIKAVGANFVAMQGKYRYHSGIKKQLQQPTPTTLTYHVGYFIIKK